MDRRTAPSAAMTLGALGRGGDRTRRRALERSRPIANRPLSLAPHAIASETAVAMATQNGRSESRVGPITTELDVELLMEVRTHYTQILPMLWRQRRFGVMTSEQGRYHGGRRGHGPQWEFFPLWPHCSSWIMKTILDALAGLGSAIV